ncbi:MAG: putative lipid II flippase FtsW [Eubacterium sp.]|nr:putative lipid II flippase FtsW [Eubacterium sp.]
MAREKKVRKTERKPKKDGRYFDYSLLFICIFTILIGYVLLYSASSYSATSTHSDSLFFLKRQIIATVIGVIGFVFVMKVNYRLFDKYAHILYYISLASIVLVRTPLGMELNGARRWVDLGIIQFQPAELVKIAVIIVTASMISKCKENSLKNPVVAIKIFARTAVAAILLFVLTSNMSSAIIVFLIGFFMIIIAGPGRKFYKYLGIALGGIAALGGIILLIRGSGFRLGRVMAWINPEQYSDDGGYQIMQGLYAIGSGGFFGKGLGNSAQKLGTLPESTNDMIFSIICEELGLFGAICVIAIFIFMILRMRNIALNVPKSDLFGTMLVVGVMLHISIQVVLNIAVVTNSMPNTGVSLPFISYGGTSLAFLITEMGLVFAVSKNIGREK